MSEEDKGEVFVWVFDFMFDDVYSYDDFEKFVGCDDVEVVYIVLFNFLYCEYVEWVVKMGKYVLCEKLLSVNEQDVQVMVDVCWVVNVLLMIVYCCQYIFEYWVVCDVVQGGKFGKVKLFDFIYVQFEDDFSVWWFKFDFVGGGLLFDVGFYSVNIICFVLGQELEWVFVVLYQLEGDLCFGEVEELVSVMLGFFGGVIVNVFISYGVLKIIILCVMGEEGSLLMDLVFFYDGLGLEIIIDDGIFFFSFFEYDQFFCEFDYFVQCVCGGQMLWMFGEEGVVDYCVMDVIYESVCIGKWVELWFVEKKDVLCGLQKLELFGEGQ